MRKHLALLFWFASTFASYCADITITAANVVPSSTAIKQNGTAGETIAAGEVVYQDSTTRKYLKADGNDTLKLPAVGIAINSASNGQPITIVTADSALTIGAHGVTIGTALYLSANAGKICPVADVTTGNKTTVVMVINTSTAVSFGIVGGVGAVP